MTQGCGAPPPVAADEFQIESLDLDGKGIAHRPDGKVVFIDGALPFERVSANVYRKKTSFEQATLTAVRKESAQRVRPACEHFGMFSGACGGCKMQHLHPAAQVAVKQRSLEDALWHLGKIRAERILRPIEGPAWAYRFRARLSVRHVAKKNTVLVGFHERNSRYVADIRSCRVLPGHVSDLLLPLRDLIGAMAARDSCPQIELACGDDLTALVLRHLVPLTPVDLDRLRQFAADHGVVQPIQWWLQSKGPDTVRPLDTPARHLCYRLPGFGITMWFRPTDFTQVNPAINQVLVARALNLLQPDSTERVIDWFCGLGNFTLALATLAGTVLGVEGSTELVARARENLALNQQDRQGHAPFAPTEFLARDLFQIDAAAMLACGTARKWLIDPPREGALALVKSLVDLQQGRQDPLGWVAPHRIVYVSCNPATLARDAGLLVHQAGYECRAAGVINMFAHTAHIESIALFERPT